MRSSPLLALALPLALLAPATPATHAAPVTTRAAATDTASARGEQGRIPRLRVRTELDGLDIPWDVQVLPGGTRLVTERSRARLSTYVDGTRTTVDFPSDRIWASGETGLMSLEVDPRFAQNRRFYTCSGWVKPGGDHDVRVNAWRLSDDGSTARRIETLVSGFPTSGGRHGGCRLLIAASGALVVGTGDAAEGTNPRNLRSLGGKTLRLNRFTGRPWLTNPFRNANNRHKRYVLTYGHRNVQGLAQRRRRHAVVGRARLLPRRRGQPAAARRRLWLAPRSRLQRERADDRPLAAGSAVGCQVALGRPHAGHQRRDLGQGSGLGPAAWLAGGRRAQGQPGGVHEVRP